jgi:hypothetical protein
MKGMGFMNKDLSDYDRLARVRLTSMGIISAVALASSLKRD